LYAITNGGQFRLVVNSVHTADANMMQLKISNMFSFKIFSRRQSTRSGRDRWCEMGFTVSY